MKPATSKEHVPPKCLFPESKDLDSGLNYRNNLIKVPSCDEHNSEKSKEDEYLQLILTNGYFNNQAGYNHFSKKITRALTRKPAILFSLYEKSNPVTVDNLTTVSIDIDRERFNRSIEHICRGLYFHEFKKTFSAPIGVHTPLLLSINEPESDAVNELVTKLSKKIIHELSAFEKRGDNSEIFWYKMLYDQPKNRLLVQLAFYGGFDVFAISDPLLYITQNG